MSITLKPLAARLASRRAPRPGIHGALGIAMLLALASHEACAATLTSLATSVGVFAALATLFVVKGLPAELSTDALPAAAGLLLVAGAGAWHWRGRFPKLSGAAVALARFEAEVPAGALRVPTGRVLVLPPGLERAPLLRELSGQFVRLQAAWDLGESAALALLTTAQMLDELCGELPGRGPGRDANRTDVVTLHAELLGFDMLGDVWMATVEFSGLIRESPQQGAAPFRELWMLTRSEPDASGWKLARHQALL